MSKNYVCRVSLCHFERRPHKTCLTAPTTKTQALCNGILNIPEVFVICPNFYGKADRAGRNVIFTEDNTSPPGELDLIGGCRPVQESQQGRRWEQSVEI